ncbi:MAG: GNAT family N-acetyltransferase, partial [Oscillospiraceae bacterium]|nr:GNAT family N-acetyltransferase [Oscillospiraceae bacterium]
RGDLKMEYRIERYKNCQRFNEQYESIYQFLLEAEKLEYNEHFHWGRFEWMHAHSYLDEDKLTSIAMFKDENGTIVGLTTYDTGYDDRVYLIHTSSDKMLLEYMVDTILEAEGDGAVIKANSNDTVLCQILQEKGFEKKHRCACILSLDLTNPLDYSMPDAYSMSPQGCVADPWQYQLVIHKGFGNDGIPERWDDEFLKRIPHVNEDLKTFAIANNEYCAHCGLWYSTGNTAYVEPVATVPEHRKQGLAKAVVYEACIRANAFGAKRAIVISDQEFYFRIGFILSSEVYDWERKN